MNTKLEKNIRKSIFKIISEALPNNTKEPDNTKEPEKPKKPKKLAPGTISTAGAFGTGGRSKKFVAAATARSIEDPEGLMRDLGVKKADGNTDLGKSLSIVNQAIHNNQLMSIAFSGASIEKKRDADNVSSELLMIFLGELDRKNGIRFMANVLEGAKNAKILQLDGGLQFVTIENEIAIKTVKTE